LVGSGLSSLVEKSHLKRSEQKLRFKFMSTNIDWAKLVSEGRAKAMGVPWTERDLQAIHGEKMSADDVRAGFFTKKMKEDYEKELAERGSEMPLEKMVKKDLIKIAKELKIDFNEKIISKGDLILEIKSKREELKIKNDGKDAENVEQKVE